MITDARVFQDEVVPQQELIVHRNAELNELTDGLQPVLDGNPASYIYLFGPTGVGKTLAARVGLQRLTELTECKTAYVNCWENHQRADVLFRVAQEVLQVPDVHRGSTPVSEVTERLRENHDIPRVIVLDEVDQLASLDVLYDLHKLPMLSVIAIANREQDLFGRMEDRIRSRVQVGRRIHFDRYMLTELLAILRKRAQHGLSPGAWSEEHLERIANRAAGDARVAINILRAAAEAARAEGVASLSLDRIDDAVPAAHDEIHAANLERLNEHQQLVYEILSDAGPLSPAELYEAYQEQAEDPVVRRSIRNYVTKMEQYDLLVAEGESHNRRLRVA